MKRKILFFILILLLFVPATSSLLYAQRDPITDIIVPPPPDNDDDRCPSGAEPGRNGECPDDSDSSDNDDPSHNDDPNTDSDGDGLSDKDDQCPTVGGPTWNAGCPEDPNDPNDPPTTVPDPNDPPPFTPPALPIDGCYVTPRINNNINVRKTYDLTADILGFLIAGNVYESQGYVKVGSDIWYALVNYEGSTGTVGYAADMVLLATSDCPEFDVPDDGSVPNPVDDFTDVPIALCDMSVGWDAPTWSTSEPQGESVVNMALWFAYEPGTPIPAGTNAVGVIYLRGGVDLPDAENIVAVMTDPMVLDAALNSDNPVEYGYPTIANGVQSGDTIFYRLTNDIGQVGDGTGNCGPIVGNIDSFSDAPSTDAQPISIPINEYACTIATSYDFIFAFNAAPGEAIPVDTAPIAIINANYVSGTPASWSATLEEVDGDTLEYMVSPVWASLVRIGGNCGPIGTARR